jgi:phosphoglycerate dehydrogenase-like enzyme
VAPPSTLEVLLHHDAGPAVQALLERHAAPSVRVRVCPVGDRQGFAAALAGADVLFHVLDPVTEGVVAAAPRLRLVQKLGVGVNTIDLEACRAGGVAVCNMPGTNAPAVAEATLLLMLACLRRLPDWHAATRRGRGWPTDPVLADRMGELAGRTVGLVGYGDIARRLEPVLLALGATVTHHARRADRPGWRPLDELLAGVDVVSLHLPLDDETAGLLDRRRLGLLRPGTVLVNTSRGGVVEQAALVDALASGRIAAAGLDVFAREPLDAADPLLRLDNVVLMPHVAWLTTETMARCLDLGFDNVRRLAAGEPLLHRVV